MSHTLPHTCRHCHAISDGRWRRSHRHTPADASTLHRLADGRWRCTPSYPHLQMLPQALRWSLALHTHTLADATTGSLTVGGFAHIHTHMHQQMLLQALWRSQALHTLTLTCRGYHRISDISADATTHLLMAAGVAHTTADATTNSLMAKASHTLILSCT